MARLRRLAGAAFLAFLFAIALVVSHPSPAAADWSQSGNVVANRSSDELTGFGFTAAGTAIAPDPNGGCYVAYLFGTNGDSIAVNRLDSDTGARLWGANGVKVNEGGNAASAPFVVEDLAGGCWVAWLDSRSGNNVLYAQRFDRNGQRGGALGGTAIAGVQGTSVPFGPSIAASPGGDLCVAFWRTASLGLFAMRIHMEFTGELPVFEMPESQMTSDTGSPSDAPIQLFADGTGGGVVVWASNRASLPGGAGTVKVVANRFNATGARQWGTEGSVVQAATGASAIGHRAYWDGTNLFVCWRHGTATSVTGIHAQKMNGSGVAQWGSTTTGVTVLTQSTTAFDNWASTNSQPQICSDGGTGVWIAWVDGRDWHRLAPNGFEHAQDLYSQRYNSAGTAQLTAGGVVADSTPGSVAQLKVVPGTSGELLMAYQTFLFESGSLGDVMVRRVNTSGSGVSNDIVHKSGSFSVSDDKQENPVVCPDGFGGLLVAWDDNRANPNLDVYAVHRTGTLAVTGPSLTLSAPNGGEALHGLEPFNVTWTSTTLSPAANVKLEYKVGNSRFLIASSTPNDGTFSWAPPSLTSNAYTVVVSEATDGTPRDSSNTSFSVCAPMDIPGSYGPVTAPSDAALADLNRDGILDLVAAGGNGPVVQLGTGTAGVGDGGFDTPMLANVQAITRSVAVADFNGDGFLDVAATIGGTVMLFTGNGTGALAFGPQLDPGGTVRGLVAADFNEDGIFDLAAANDAHGWVTVFIGQGVNGVGNGSFAPAVQNVVGSGPRGLAAVDLDHDGILDLVVTNNTANSVVVMKGNGAAGLGNGTFTVGSPIAVTAGPSGLCTGDFDEDGDPDVAIATNGGVTVLIGQGTGAFDPPVNYALGSSANDVVAGDINGDGRQDLWAACGSTDRVIALFGNGSGSTGDGTFTIGGIGGGGNNPVALVLGDILEDNVLDGVMMNSSGNDEYPFWGDCGTSLGTSVAVIAPNGGEVLQVGSVKTITWTKGPGNMSVDIDVSRDNGAHWQTIATNQTGTSFVWNVTPPAANGTALVRVRDTNLQNRNDVSNAAFTITDGSVGVEPVVAPTFASFSKGRPNPSHGDVSFEMALPRESEVHVDVFDLGGRRVSTLASGHWPAGLHVVRWDGGRAAAPGVYFVRARWQGYDVTRSVVRME